MSRRCAVLQRSSQMNVENTHNRISSGYMTCCKNSFITFIKLSRSWESGDAGRVGEGERRHHSFHASFLRWTQFFSSLLLLLLSALRRLESTAYSLRSRTAIAWLLNCAAASYIRYISLLFAYIRLCCFALCQKRYCSSAHQFVSSAFFTFHRTQAHTRHLTVRLSS